MGEGGEALEVEHLGKVTDFKLLQFCQEKFIEIENNPVELEKYLEVFGRFKDSSLIPPQYLKRQESIIQTMEWQKVPPTKPEKPFASALRVKVLALVRNQFGQNLSENSVNYYTACSDCTLNGKKLKTPLDFYHGIDAFFIIHIGSRQVLITMDGSKREKIASRGELQSDILIKWPEDGLDRHANAESFDDFVNLIAEEVVNKIN
jgi:hypothetical protein